MKAIIVRESINGGFDVLETTTESLIEFALSKGYQHSGFNSNPRQREQLQNQPQFKGLLGPMWDGDKVRYEDQKTYDTLSA